MSRKLLPLLLFLPLGACSNELDVPATPQGVRQTYSPADGEIPVPNDLLFVGSADGTLNLPASTNPDPIGQASEQLLIDAFNSLDGWSTSAPLSFGFDAPVDPATVVGGSSVRLFEVSLAVNPTTGLTLGMPVTGLVRELSSPTEFVVAPASASNDSYAVVPTAPYSGSTSYMLVVTDGVLDTDGQPTRPSSVFELARGVIDGIDLPPDHPLDGLQALIDPMVVAAGTATPPIERTDIVMSLTFTTQSLFDVHGVTSAVAAGGEAAILAQLAAGGFLAAGGAAPANTVPTAAPGVFVGDTAAIVPGLLGHADLYTASLTLPYYLTAAANPNGQLSTDPGPLLGRWTARFGFLEGAPGFPADSEKHVTSLNPLPLQTGEETIPMLVSVPNANSLYVQGGGTQPAEGWPVVIFLHGITRNRSDLVAIADAFADIGFAAVAIDQPLHGIVDDANPLHVGTQDGGLRERTFGLDLAGGGANGNLPDMVADASGAHFINIGSPQTQRDNLRQAVADLFAVVKVLQDDWDIDGVGLAEDFDDARIHFVGVSFGGIVGTPFCAVSGLSPTPTIKSATLSVSGGGLPKMLADSATFGPGLLASLAAFGVVPGTPEYEQLMTAFQSLVDSGDPINFSPALGASSVPVLLHEVIGGGPGGGLADQVVPNAVAGAPLSGTEPMIAALGLTSVGAAGDTAASKAVVRFIEGTHGSLLDPDPEGDGLSGPTFDAFVEMQRQVASWLASISLTPTVSVADDSVVQQP